MKENLQSSPKSPLELPKLGHQLKISECRSVKGWHCISLVPAQKLRSFALLFVQGLLLATGVLAVLFGPDFLLDYAHRESGFVAFFGKFFGCAVLFITICAFIVMAMRSASIYINIAENRIISAARLTSQLAADSISISEIEKAQTDPPSGLFKKSRLRIRIQDAEVILAECQGNNEDLLELRDWLNAVSCEKI